MLMIMVERRYREGASEKGKERGRERREGRKGEREGKENSLLCFLHTWKDYYATFNLELIPLADALHSTLVAYLLLVPCPHPT